MFASRYQMLEEGECIFGPAARARNLARTEADLFKAREEAHHIRQRTESFQALLRLWPTERITLVDRVIVIAELQKQQAAQQAEHRECLLHRPDEGLLGDGI